MAEYNITDLNDPQLEPYRDLKQTNLTRWSGIFLAEGLKVVERLLESDYEVISVLVSERQRHRLPDNLGDRVELLTIAQEPAEQLVGYNFHAGVLACGRRQPNPELDDFVTSASPQLLVGVTHLTDPANLGTIIRVSAALGAAGLLVGEKSPDPFSRRSLRVSMGTALSFPIRETTSIHADLTELRSQGFCVAASVLNPQAIPLSDYSPPDRLVLLLGNESEGLDEVLIAFADDLLTIPMVGGVDSLNVGIAAGILVHQIRSRQRHS